MENNEIENIDINLKNGNIYKNKITSLQDQLARKFEENQNLKKELNKKNDIISVLMEKNSKLQKLLNDKKNNTNINLNDPEYKEIISKLLEKEKEIENLKYQLLGTIKYDAINIDEKLIAINFTSGDQIINFPIICKTNCQFIDLEKKLYQKYPEYAGNDGKDNLFLGNGTQINRFKTMAENGFPGYAITVMKNITNDD